MNEDQRPSVANSPAHPPVHDEQRASREHPLLLPDGYQINTKPTERLANFIRMNLFEGHHGCSVYGSGGVGKTTAITYLTDNASRWLIDSDRRPMAVGARMVMPSGVRRTDRAFWRAMTERLGLGTSSSATSAVGMAKIRNLIASRCGQANVNTFVLFIDNAQRISEAEYEYLEDLDSMVRQDRLSLFLVLVRQSDAEGVDVGDDWRDRATHSIRRWFMHTAPFGPLQGIEEVAHALSGYDAVAWPTPDMPFSRYFAREAFDGGWRLGSQSPLIWEVANEMRKKAKLPDTDSWPMATLTLMVRHLLHEIAFRRAGFDAFTADDVVTALRSCSFLRLEYVRTQSPIPVVG